MSLADDIAAAVRAGADEAERAVAELIAAEARRIAPVGPADDPHRGLLRDSIRVERNETGGWTVFADTPYAAKQHEALHFRHAHGQAKFLEHPLQTVGAQLDRVVAGTVERHLRTGHSIRGVHDA